MDGSLAEVVELIRRKTGISLPPCRTSALRSAMNRVAPGLGPAALVRAAADPRTGPSLLQRLIDEVTVQESSFLRDAAQLEAIGWHLPGEAAAGKIRVWSAACATGEEAYTLALLATEAFTPAVPPVDVLGTDISHAALAAAAAGRYRERAVRGLKAALRQRYLVKQPDDTYLVNDWLRGLVRFQPHNLAHDPIPPRGEAAFDLIVCRNVLIYLTPQVVQRVCLLLEQALRPGGVLVLGAADVLCRTSAFAGSPHARPTKTTAHHTARPTAPRPAGPDAHRSRQPRQPYQPPQSRSPADGGVPAGQPEHRDQLKQPDQREQRLRGVLDAAGLGNMEYALEQVALLIVDDPLDADAFFLLGLLTLEAGEPTRARDALRGALYADPAFGLAAFTLGRAYDALGDLPAARRAYELALRTLDPGDSRHEVLLQQIDMGDIAAACRARLGARQ